MRYIREIEAVLKSKGVLIRNKHEFKAFFNEQPDAGALTSGTNVFRDLTVVVQSPEDDWWKLRAWANQLAHEAVYAMQALKYPRMPDEEAEREAYYYQILTPDIILRAASDPDHLIHNLKLIESFVLSSTAINRAITSP